jgi:hypothetical protein
VRYVTDGDPTWLAGATPSDRRGLRTSPRTTQRRCRMGGPVENEPLLIAVAAGYLSKCGTPILFEALRADDRRVNRRWSMPSVGCPSIGPTGVTSPVDLCRSVASAGRRSTAGRSLEGRSSAPELRYGRRLQ